MQILPIWSSSCKKKLFTIAISSEDSLKSLINNELTLVNSYPRRYCVILYAEGGSAVLRMVSIMAMCLFNYGIDVMVAYTPLAGPV